jgi:antirestriction protein ArdC
MARDLYQEVTDRIIEQLEKGVAPWVRPWRSNAKGGGMPYNAVSGKSYRGINVALLFTPQYVEQGWMTYKQAADVGANVRKGEKGSMIVFYKPFVVRDRNAPNDGQQHDKTIPLLRAFHVFNTAQIENRPAKYLPEPDTRPDVERHASAESLLSRATVRHGGDRAFYVPSSDFIQMPHAADFRTVAEYYGTALHELTHWTGHTSRMAREYGKRFGDQAYAREELVAEMGAAYLCANVGIAGSLQHPEYLASWLSVLKSDKRAILIAASAAQRAADFVIGPVAVESDDSESVAA